MRACQRLTAWVLAVALALTLGIMLAPTAPAAPADPTPPPAAGQEQTANVDLVLFHAMPQQLDIKTGTTVTWTNKELFDYPLLAGRHEIKADDGSFASPAMAPGTRWSHRFTKPGTFTYHCAHHPDLAGTLVITGDPIIDTITEEVAITEDKPDDPTSWAFHPNDLVITTGSTVVWRNNGTNTHTVTSSDKLFESGNIAPGATWKYTFDQPGTFAYHCTPHPWMTASIRVATPGDTPPPPPPPPAAPAAPTSTRGTREPASARHGTGPVRHDVDIVETDPAKPTSWAFDPPSLDVRTGDTVVWRNTGAMSHTITSNDGTFESGLISPGATWSRTFDAPAFVAYHCTPHPWMKGIVRVATLEGPPPAPPARLAAATATLTRSKTPEPLRQGSGPVTHTVDILEPNTSDAMSWGFDPKTLDVRAGDTVVWHNTGTLQHSVTADSFDAGLVNPATTWSKKFDTPGIYLYHCTPHPWMKGIVRVTSTEGGPLPPVPPGIDTVAIPGATGEQAASILPSPLTPANLPFPPEGLPGGAGPKLALALLVSFLVVGFTWFLAATPWRPRPEAATVQTPGHQN